MRSAAVFYAAVCLSCEAIVSVVALNAFAPGAVAKGAVVLGAAAVSALTVSTFAQQNLAVNDVDVPVGAGLCMQMLHVLLTCSVTVAVGVGAVCCRLVLWL